MISSFEQTLAQIALFLPALLIGVTVHEAAHALSAYLLGDPTAKLEGRLTLNPIPHIDFMGLLFLLLFRIGWAKPVHFDMRNFKHPRFYAILCALAGPFSNFLLAIVSLYCIKYIPLLGFLSGAALTTFYQIFYAITQISITLGVFNLLPIPGLDGSYIIMIFLFDKYPLVAEWIYRYSIFIIFILLFLLPTHTFIANTVFFMLNFLSSFVL